LAKEEKMKKTLIAAAVIGAASLSGRATTFNFMDQDFIDVVLGSGSQNFAGTAGSANATFDIATQDSDIYTDVVGYNPALMTITSAAVGFNFTELSTGGSYEVSFTIGANAPSGSGPLLPAGNGTTFSFGGIVGGVAFADLSADGILSYSVSWVNGADFKLDTASLQATAVDRVTNVPDSGSTMTMMLLGASALGLAVFPRRKVA
jgi:hypothetical protein